jgi:hypothetical protein
VTGADAPAASSVAGAAPTTGATELVTWARAFVVVDWAGATVLVTGAGGPLTAGAEGCVGAVDGCAGAEVAGDAAGWAPPALPDEVAAGGPDGAGG